MSKFTKKQIAFYSKLKQQKLHEIGKKQSVKQKPAKKQASNK